MACWVGIIPSLASALTNTAFLDHQHVEMKILYTAAGTNHLAIQALDTETQILYPSNQVVLVVKSSSETSLPGGTPFGHEGDPIWILPDTPDPTLLTVGYSSEGMPQGVFSSPLDFRLKAVSGPGTFFLWQATQFGGLDVKMNTRDGITASDKFTLSVGSHEHFFWGFTSTGIYCLTFQSVGTRVGDATPTASLETTFVFHVLPLPNPTNFLIWQKTQWPPWTPTTDTATAADPDGDKIANIFEYAFNLDPKQTNASGLPSFSFVTVNNQKYGALRYNRYRLAADVSFQAQAANTVTGAWTTLTNIFSVVTNGLTDSVTMRDNQPGTTSAQRFYRLQLNVH
jgi:surface-anchored protein